MSYYYQQIEYNSNIRFNSRDDNITYYYYYYNIPSNTTLSSKRSGPRFVSFMYAYVRDTFYDKTIETIFTKGFKSFFFSLTPVNFRRVVVLAIILPKITNVRDNK